MKIKNFPGRIGAAQILFKIKMRCFMKFIFYEFLITES